MRCLVFVRNCNALVLRRALSFVELPSVLLQGHVWGFGPRGHEEGANFLLLQVEDNRVIPKFLNHCVGSLIGVPNVVHKFGDNVLFVHVCDDRGDGILVDCKIEFVLAPGDFVIHMECILVVGKSGQGDPWVFERRFDGAAEIQGVVVCDSVSLVFAYDEGKDAAFLPYRLVLKMVAIWAIALTSSSMASYSGDPMMRGRPAAPKRALTIASMATTLVIVMASSVSAHIAVGMA